MTRGQRMPCQIGRSSTGDGMGKENGRKPKEDERIGCMDITHIFMAMTHHTLGKNELVEQMLELKH